uniref:Acid phosphatase n=1 Tax=Amphora coffeiformis TaxID=265554 RepID=A0A7S3LBQ8_9STRA|eukprot:scaffold710_cov171-Amphora_coffeaeformis.AAC.59
MNHLHRFCLLVAPLFAVVGVFVRGETIVKQMHVITRHGSRYPLEKQADNLQENTPGSLTAYGQKQMFDLGMWVKETYNSTGFFQVYVPWEVRLESSSFDRTLVSADSFAMGAFDYAARDPRGENLLPQLPPNIPVYSTDNEDDVYIRSYDKCPAFHDKLQKLYSTQEWQDMEQKHLSLLQRLGQLESFRNDADSSGKVPLTNLWNVFDSLHVAKTECTLSGEGLTLTCLSLPNPEDRFALNDAEFEELEQLTSSVEHLRYGPDQADRLLGGPLLLRIIDRMERHLSGNFFLYSAHYATILGVLSALGESLESTGTIPDYASALIFLLQEDTTTGQQHIQVVYKKDSRASTPPTVIPLGFCLNEVTCPAATFATRWKGYSIAEWCRECGNRNAGVCLDYMVEEYEGENFGLDEPLVAGLLIGFGTSAALSLFCCFFCSTTKIKWDKRDGQERPVKQSMAPEIENLDGSTSSLEVPSSQQKEPVMA